MGAHEFGLDQETVTGFLDEAGKHIETLNERLLAIEQGKAGQGVSQQVVAEMFRAAHSLKGAAGFLKLTDIAGVTHRMESVLDQVRHGKLTFTNQVVEALFRSFDVVSSLLAEVGGGAAGHVDTVPVMALLTAALGGQPPVTAAVATPIPVVAPAPTQVVSAPATGDDPAEQHLGRLPDWLRGRLTEDDVCEALFASGDGAKSVALRFDAADLLQFTKGPVAAMTALGTSLRVRRILHLVAGPEELWAPLREYSLHIGVFAFVTGDVDAILGALDVPHGAAWILHAGEPARERRIGRDPASAVKRHDQLIVKADSVQHLSLWLGTTRETLAELDAVLLDLERAPMESAHVDCVFRHLHSLKGASATMGLDEVARIAHQGENLLAAVRDGRMRLDPEAIASLFATKDAVQTCVDRVERHETESPDTTALDAALGRHLTGLIDARAVLPVWHPNEGEIAAARAASGNKPLWKLRLVLAAQAPLADLRLGMVLNNLSKVAHIALSRPTLAELERGLPDPPPLVALFASSLPLKSLIEAITCDHVRDWSIDPVAVSDEPAAAVTVSSSAETRQASAAAIDTVRVDTARLDHLLNTTGELVITKARLSQQVDTLMRLLDSVDLRVLEGLVAQTADLAGGRVASGIQALRRAQEEVRRTRDTTLDLHRHTGAMQNSVMRARMVPIGPLFQRFHRLVRDLCKERGREAKMVTFGEGTELDKKLIDEIGDPLTHLIRNGVDHGLETPDEREAAGKPRCGSVHLEAFHQGGMVCIRVRDDGRGLVMEKIRAKAIERGLVTAEAANRMSASEVYQFIFLPGFSTAAQVTNISGRGVGMDIVKSKITALKAKVEITSEPGHGATFTIALPLTLAMIDSLLVRIGEGRFAFPLDSVREIVEVKLEEVHTVEGKGRVIFLRDQVISLLDLNRVMGICPLTGARDTVRAVITKGGSETLAIAVDQVIGDEEIVVKPLGQEFALVHGLSGATVLGDGGVALILDIHGIHELTRVKRAPAQAVGV